MKRSALRQCGGVHLAIGLVEQGGDFGAVFWHHGHVNAHAQVRRLASASEGD